MAEESSAILSIIRSEKIIIGTLSSCIAPSCKGWIVDSFCGKYWIKCQDPKHINTDENKDGEKRLGFHTQPNIAQSMVSTRSLEGDCDLK